LASLSLRERANADSTGNSRAEIFFSFNFFGGARVLPAGATRERENRARAPRWRREAKSAVLNLHSHHHFFSRYLSLSDHRASFSRLRLTRTDSLRLSFTIALLKRNRLTSRPPELPPRLAPASPSTPLRYVFFSLSNSLLFFFLGFG